MWKVSNTVFKWDTLTNQTLFRGLWLTGVWLHLWKKLYKSFCVSRGSWTKSTKLSQVMSLKSLLGGAKDYKFKNATNRWGRKWVHWFSVVRSSSLLASSSKFFTKTQTLHFVRFNWQCFSHALVKWGTNTFCEDQVSDSCFGLKYKLVATNMTVDVLTSRQKYLVFVTTSFWNAKTPWSLHHHALHVPTRKSGNKHVMWTWYEMYSRDVNIVGGLWQLWFVEMLTANQCWGWLYSNIRLLAVTK